MRLSPDVVFQKKSERGPIGTGYADRINLVQWKIPPPLQLLIATMVENFVSFFSG